MSLFARITVRRWWMVWLSQLAARPFAGLEQRLLGEEGAVKGESHVVGGVPERSIVEGMTGRK